MSHKVRMADIAERLGVSIVTVSKALSGKDGVGDAMRARILELAKEMGYVPLRTKPEKKKQEEEPVTGNIGILMADHFFAVSSFYSGLSRQVLRYCSEEGYSALLELVSADAERSCTLPAVIQGRKVDGIIFIGEISRDYIRAVTACGLPYMLLDFYDEELNANSVTSDNVVGGYLLANHLIQTGRTRIGFVGSIHATSSIMDRFLGYRKAQLRAGIPTDNTLLLDDRDENGTLIPIKLPQQMPDAFICSYDEVAHNLAEQLKQAGYRVPEDVAVTGYDDLPVAQFSTPQLTTYRVNFEVMGQMVVSQLIRRIQGKPFTRGNIVINGRLIRREST